MKANSKIYGIIKTKNGRDLYIKDYKCSAKSIKFTLTDKEKYNMSFSGRYKNYNYEEKNIPNYNPLMRIRLILTNCATMKYLKFKTIMVKEVFDDENNTTNIEPLPNFSAKFKKLKDDAKVIVKDETENITWEFNVISNNEENLSKYTLNFGLHKGKTIQEVYETYPDYLEWMIKQKEFGKQKAQEKVKKFLNIIKKDKQNQTKTTQNNLEEKNIKQNHNNNNNNELEKELETYKSKINQLEDNIKQLKQNIINIMYEKNEINLKNQFLLKQINEIYKLTNIELIDENDYSEIYSYA